MCTYVCGGVQEEEHDASQPQSVLCEQGPEELIEAHTATKECISITW